MTFHFATLRHTTVSTHFQLALRPLFTEECGLLYLLYLLELLVPQGPSPQPQRQSDSPRVSQGRRSLPLSPSDTSEERNWCKLLHCFLGRWLLSGDTSTLYISVYYTVQMPLVVMHRGWAGM
jgi:hypothetical protein